MAFKIIVLCAALAVANAGLLGAPAAYGAYGVAPAYGYGSNLAYGGAVGASHQSTLRSLDGNQVVSQYSKSVNTPFSSVSKTDTRVTNDAVAYAHAPAVAAYAAPAYHGAYAAPAVAAYAAPAYHGAYAAPAIRAYAAPAVTAYHGAYAAPAVAAYHGAYAAPAVRAYAAPAVAAYHGAYAAPAVRAYATPAVAAYGGAYAPAYAGAYAAPAIHGAVSHIAFDGIGAHYAY